MWYGRRCKKPYHALALCLHSSLRNFSVSCSYSLLLALATAPCAAISLTGFEVAPIVPQHFSHKVLCNLSGEGEFNWKSFNRHTTQPTRRHELNQKLEHRHSFGVLLLDGLPDYSCCPSSTPYDRYQATFRRRYTFRHLPEYRQQAGNFFDES
jgi:hypothetical protein